MPTCLRCNWVVNVPLEGKRLRELVTSMSHWLHLAGVRGTNNLQLEVRRNLDNFKAITMNTTKYYPICRHCLVEAYAEQIEDDFIRKYFEDSFFNYYKFDSVIY
jgi:hypothetical protein